MTQTEAILAHLRSGKTITPRQADRIYGCMRLGARIWDLKQDGHQIVKRMVYDRRSRKHWAEYRLSSGTGEAA